jgi:drug/metabolite transporter (DMT)-like permease
MSGWAIPVALGAAALFGWSTAGMHHGASGAMVRHPGWRGLLILLRQVVRQWRWITGLIASLLGVVLHAMALRMGSLAVVQPVMVSGLVLSFLFRSALDRRAPPPRTLLWSMVTTVALAVFLWAGRETHGNAQPHSAHAALALAVGATAAVGCWWLSTRTRPSVSGILLGFGTGVIFGLTAGTLKATAAEGGPGHLITNWPLYVLLCLGVVGFLANQIVYRRPLASSIPALNVANPLVALAYGAVAFSEKPAGQMWALAVDVCSLATVLIGVAFLARAESANSSEVDRVVAEDDELDFASAA